MCAFIPPFLCRNWLHTSELCTRDSGRFSTCLRLMCTCACYHQFAVTIICLWHMRMLDCVPLTLWVFDFRHSIERKFPMENGKRWKKKIIFRASVPHGKHSHFISIHIKLWFEKYFRFTTISIASFVHWDGKRVSEWERKRARRKTGMKKSRYELESHACNNSVPFNLCHGKLLSIGFGTECNWYFQCSVIGFSLCQRARTRTPFAVHTNNNNRKSQPFDLLTH